MAKVELSNNAKSANTRLIYGVHASIENATKLQGIADSIFGENSPANVMLQAFPDGRCALFLVVMSIQTNGFKGALPRNIIKFNEAIAEVT